MTSKLPALLLVAVFAACSEGTMTSTDPGPIDGDGGAGGPDAGTDPPGDGGGPTADTGPGPDAGTIAPTRTECILPPAADGAPELPREVVDTRWIDPTGSTIEVAAGGDFQAALDAASPGDEIVLEAGAVFTGNFTLPEKSGAGYILIRSSALDALPPEGTRVSPADAPSMPALVTPSELPVIRTADRAHHYRFAGIEMRPAAGVSPNALVDLGSYSATDVAELAHHVILDRCYIHGDPDAGGKRGVQLNSAWTAIVDSYLSDWKRVGQDTQAIGGWNGPGPYRIVNNYLEGAGENVMFGGADAVIPDLIPSDIEICGNHFDKPLAWMESDPSFAGTAWSVKNLFELKTGRRVLVSANLFEHCWVHAQTGFAIVIKSANQSGGQPWAVTEHLTFAYNVVRHSASGFNLARTDGDSLGTNRVRVYGNLFYDIGSDRWGGGGRLFQVLGGVDDTSIEHNTGFGRQVFLSMDGSPPNERFVFRANVLGPTTYGAHGSGQGEGTSSLDAFTPGAVFADNVLVGATESRYPTGNHFPPTLDDVGFVDHGAADYRIDEASPYDELGADAETLMTMATTVSGG